MAHRQPRISNSRLSDLQKVILRWLRTEVRRRRRAGNPEGIAYPDLVRGLKVNKVDVTKGLRHLMRKGLVFVSLPRGAWVRYIHLTEQGGDRAQALSKEQRKQRFKQYATTMSVQDTDGRRRHGRVERHTQRRRARRQRRRLWEEE